MQHETLNFSFASSSTGITKWPEQPVCDTRASTRTKGLARTQHHCHPAADIRFLWGGDTGVGRRRHYREHCCTPGLRLQFQASGITHRSLCFDVAFLS